MELKRHNKLWTTVKNSAKDSATYKIHDNQTNKKFKNEKPDPTNGIGQTL